MKLIKPNFWDYKKPNFLSYILLPFTLPILLNNFFLNKGKGKDKDKVKKITNICIGNIYLGGTGKTPLSIKVNQILKNLDFNVAVIKKFYKDQVDEQTLIGKTSKLYCFKKRMTGLTQALNDGVDIAIYDDGLQDKTINYDLSFVCFNNTKWIIVVDKERLRPTDITLQIPDSTKFREETGWPLTRTLKDICENLLAYWRNV